MLIRDFLTRHQLQPSTLSAAAPENCSSSPVGPSGARSAATRRESWLPRAPLRVFEQPSPSGLPFPDQSFDLVTAASVYHHVHGIDRRAQLTESIRRVLKPRGRHPSSGTTGSGIGQLSVYTGVDAAVTAWIHAPATITEELASGQ
jgi:SAM-dependent methyltransferase